MCYNICWFLKHHFLIVGRCVQTWKMYQLNELWRLVDPNMMSESMMEEIVQVIKIGLVCVQTMLANRPKMSSVVAMLLDNKQVENVCIVAESVRMVAKV